MEATDFLEACKAGTFHEDELKENLNAGTRKRGLHEAAGNGHLEIVRRLLDIDSSIKVTYLTAWAAVLGGLPVYRFLHSQYPDMIHWSFDHGGCAVYQACKVKDMEVLKYLLENGADPGRTRVLKYAAAYIFGPMDAAVWNDDEEALRLLVKYGATLKSREALKDAAHFGRLKAARCLLDMGNDVNYIRQFGDPELDHCDNCTAPLHAAVGQGDIHMVQLLLANGADARLRDPDGKTAFDVARVEGFLRILRLLQEREDWESPEY